MAVHTAGMDTRAAKPYDFTLLAIGPIVAAFGFGLILVGLGLVPPPGRIYGPTWLAAAGGVIFLLGGVCVGLRAYLKMDDSETEPPAGTPMWAKLTFWLSGVAIASALAAIGTWIAFGEGPRNFGFSIPGVISGPAGDGAGRVIFGIGAILTWLAVIAFVRVGYRKVFGK